MATVRPTVTPNGYELSEVYQTLAIGVRTGAVENSLLAAAEADMAGYGRQVFRVMFDTLCADVGMADPLAVVLCIHHYNEWSTAVGVGAGGRTSESATVENARRCLLDAVRLAASASKSRLAFNAAATTAWGDVRTLHEVEADTRGLPAENAREVLDSIRWTEHLYLPKDVARPRDARARAKWLDARRVMRLFVALLDIARQTWSIVDEALRSCECSAHSRHTDDGVRDQAGRDHDRCDECGHCAALEVAGEMEASLLKVAHMVYAIDAVEGRRVAQTAASCPAGGHGNVSNAPRHNDDDDDGGGSDRHAQCQPSFVAMPLGVCRAKEIIGERHASRFAVLDRASSESVFSRPLLWAYGTLAEFARVHGLNAAGKPGAQPEPNTKQLIWVLLSLTNLTGESVVDDHVAFVLAVLFTARAGRFAPAQPERRPSDDASVKRVLALYDETLDAMARVAAQRAPSVSSPPAPSPSQSSATFPSLPSLRPAENARRLVIPPEALNVFTFRGRGTDTSSLFDAVLADSAPSLASPSTARSSSSSPSSPLAATTEGNSINAPPLSRVAFTAADVAAWGPDECARSQGSGVVRDGEAALSGQRTTHITHWFDRSAVVSQSERGQARGIERALAFGDGYAEAARRALVEWEEEQEIDAMAAGARNRVDARGPWMRATVRGTVRLPHTRHLVKHRYADWLISFGTPAEEAAGEYGDPPAVVVPPSQPRSTDVDRCRAAAEAVGGGPSCADGADGKARDAGEGAPPAHASHNLCPGQTLLTVSCVQEVVPIGDPRLVAALEPGSWRTVRRAGRWVHQLALDGCPTRPPASVPELSSPGQQEEQRQQPTPSPSPAPGVTGQGNVRPSTPSPETTTIATAAPAAGAATTNANGKKGPVPKAKPKASGKRAKAGRESAFDIMASMNPRELKPEERQGLERGWLARVPANRNNKASVLTACGSVLRGPYRRYNPADAEQVKRMMVRNYRARHCWGRSIVIDQEPCVDPTPGGVGDADRLGDRDDTQPLFYFCARFLGTDGTRPPPDASRWRPASGDGTRRAKKPPLNPDAIVATLPPQMRRLADRHPELAAGEGVQRLGAYVLPRVVDRASTGIVPFSMLLPEDTLRRHLPAVVRDLAVRYLLQVGNAQLGNVIMTADGEHIGSLHMNENRERTPLLAAAVGSSPGDDPGAAVPYGDDNVTLASCLFAGTKGPPPGYEKQRFNDLLPLCFGELHDLVRCVESEDRSLIAAYCASIGLPGQNQVERSFPARLDTLKRCIEHAVADHQDPAAAPVASAPDEGAGIEAHPAGAQPGRTRTKTRSGSDRHQGAPRKRGRPRHDDGARAQHANTSPDVDARKAKRAKRHDKVQAGATAAKTTTTTTTNTATTTMDAIGTDCDGDDMDFCAHGADDRGALVAADGLAAPLQQSG